jgi:hypothetical protein
LGASGKKQIILGFGIEALPRKSRILKLGINPFGSELLLYIKKEFGSDTP